MKILGCPPFLKYITPNYPPWCGEKIWNVHKNIRTLHKDHKKQKWNGGLVILAEKWWIFTFLTPKSPPKPPKITFSKNPKKRFLLVPRRVLIPNFKSLCRKLRPGARRTHTQTDKKLKKGEYFSVNMNILQIIIWDVNVVKSCKGRIPGSSSHQAYRHSTPFVLTD